MSNPTPAPQARPYHYLLAGCFIGLALWLCLWLAWLAPPPKGWIAPSLLVVVGPLMIPLRGILHGRRYTVAWSTLLLALYVIHGLVAFAAAPPVRWLGLLELVLVGGYFFGAVKYLRLTRQTDSLPGE